MRAWEGGYHCHQLNKKTQEPWLQLWHFKNVTFIGIFFSLSFFHQKSKTPVVTTAEVSSDQSTNADSPEQPQAITMATQPKPSLSTVHVQQSFHGIRSSIPVLTHSASEVKFASCFYCNFDFCQPLSYISMLIFPAVIHIFPRVLLRRICLTIESFFSWWSFPLFSWLWLILWREITIDVSCS